MIIAIFEDNPADAEQLKGLCSRWGRKSNCSIKLWVFETAKQLEDELSDRRQYDFYFLDIMTPKDSSAGFRLAERIRRADDRAPIVFTTNSREYVESAFEISASQYLLKPLEEEKVFRALDRGFKEILRKTENIGDFSSPDRRLRLSYNKILYVESFARNHHAILHMTDEAEHEIILSGLSFKDLVSKKLPKQFIQCHKSYAINLEYVTGYSKKSVLLSFDKEIPVGSDFYQDLINGIINGS